MHAWWHGTSLQNISDFVASNSCGYLWALFWLHQTELVNQNLSNCWTCHIQQNPTVAMQTVLRIVKHQTTACSNCAHNTPHNDWLAGVLLTYSWGPILLFGAGSLQFLRQLSLLVSMMSMLRWGGGISRSHMVDATLMVRSSCGWYCWHHPDMGRWVLFGGVGEFSITPGSYIYIDLYWRRWASNRVCGVVCLVLLLGNHPVDWNKVLEIQRPVSPRLGKSQNCWNWRYPQKPGAFFFVFWAEEQQLVYDSSMKLYQQTAAVDDLLEPVVLPEESEESVALEPCAICGWANVEHGEHSR